MLICAFSFAAKAATIAHWDFNDREAGTVLAAGDRIADSSGRGNDLYVNLGATYSLYDYADPAYGDELEGALRMAVGNGHLYFQPGHEFSDGGPAAGMDAIGDIMPQSFTYEIVFRCPYNPTTTTVYGLMSKISGAAADPQFWWRIESAGGIKINFNLKHSVSVNSVSLAYTYPTGQGLYDGKWHHAAVVRDYGQSKLKLYVDYQLMNEVTTGFWNDVAMTVPFTIGNFASGTTRDFVGNIDQVRISDAALAPAAFIEKTVTVLPANPAPADKAYNIATGSVVLSWDTVAQIDPNNVVNSHTVTVALDREMTNVYKTFNGVTGNSVTLTGVTTAKDYYWRVDTQGTNNSVAFFTTGSVWRFQAAEAAGDVAGLWTFNDGVRGSVIEEGDMITDSSGNNRHLYTLYEVKESNPVLAPNYGNPSASYGPGASYQAYTDSMLKLLPGYNFGAGKVAGGGIYVASDESITIETVVKLPPAANNVGAIFAYIPDHPEETYWFSSNLPQIWLRTQDTGVARFWIQDNAAVSSYVDSTVLVNDGNWHHIAAVIDRAANELKLYVDYVNVTTKANTTTQDIVPNGYMAVGGFHGYNSRNTSGSIDFVKVTRAALTPSEFVLSLGALPTNPSPVDGAAGVPSTYILSWDPIASATITSQSVVLATDVYMQNVVSTITATGNTAQVSGLLNNTTYYWRVDSVGSDAGGSFDREGEVWAFSTPACLLTATDGDINGDCIINNLDLAVMASNWLRSEFE